MCELVAPIVIMLPSRNGSVFYFLIFTEMELGAVMLGTKEISSLVR